MANPFDRPGGPPPDFAVPGADGLAEVIPLRPRGSSGTRPDSAHSVRAGTQHVAADLPPRGSRHPAGRRLRSAGVEPAPEADREPDPHDVARAIALKALTGAPRTRRQLADKLARHGCDALVAREVVDRLQDVGLVGDRDFAQAYVRSRQESRGLGRRALAAELRHKGVDDDIVRDVLDDVDEEQERERARALVAKKLAAMHGLDARVQTRRLAGMLARKGYAASLARSVIRETIADASDSPAGEW